MSTDDDTCEESRRVIHDTDQWVNGEGVTTCRRCGRMVQTENLGDAGDWLWINTHTKPARVAVEPDLAWADRVARTEGVASLADAGEW